MKLNPGWKARATAGNDRDKIYDVKEDLGEYVLLVRGDGKLLRKNKKHIQVIKTTSNH